MGAVFGPPVAGRIFDATHSYVVAYSLFGASYFAAAIASYISRPYEAEVSRLTSTASSGSPPEARDKPTHYRDAF